jgi:hypothetical protein
MLRANVQDIKSWVREEDISVVDRGFWDALSLLEDLGIKAEIPCFMKRGEKQLSTEDANLSRLVTKVHIMVQRKITMWRCPIIFKGVVSALGLRVFLKKIFWLCNSS